MNEQGQVIEIKTRSRGYLYRRAWPNEIAQMHVYMYLTGTTECAFVETVESGASTFEDTITWDQTTWDDITAKLGHAVRLIAAKL